MSFDYSKWEALDTGSDSDSDTSNKSAYPELNQHAVVERAGAATGGRGARPPLSIDS
jgi:hypothetical protein